MKAFLKQLFSRNPVGNGRTLGYPRSYQFDSGILLVASLATLSIAVVGWAGLMRPVLRYLMPYAFTFVVFFAPALTALSAIDIRKRGLTRNRGLAFICAAIATGLAAARIYQIVSLA